MTQMSISTYERRDGYFDYSVRLPKDVMKDLGLYGERGMKVDWVADPDTGRIIGTVMKGNPVNNPRTVSDACTDLYHYKCEDRKCQCPHHDDVRR